MNRPSFSARVAASVPGAIVIFLVCAALVSGWYQGQFPWWLALGAVFGALRMIESIRKVRRYRAWRAQWNAMSGDAPVKKRSGALTKVAATIAVLSLMAMAGAPRQNDQAFVVGMPLMFGASALYLLASLALLVVVRPMRQAARRRGEARKQKARAEAEAAPVAWLLPPASSAPSRADAVNNLPDYCTRLISESQTRRERVMKSATTAICIVASIALMSAQSPGTLPPLERWATSGDAAAQYETGRRYFAEGKPLDAMLFLLQAAMKDYAPAQFEIGMASVTGAGGLPRDYKTAAGWFKIASDHGDLKAQAMLGKMHIYTKFGMVDHALAARLLEEPAHQGDPESQFLLAGMYVEQNKDSEGIGWLMRAARQGVAEAQAMVAGLALAGVVSSGGRDTASEGYIWATLALAAKPTLMKDDDLAKLAKLRDAAAARMTDGQVSEAGRRAREWRPVRECADCATYLMVKPPA